jgi:aspartate aminotransferase-like enzyme
MLMKYRLFTPGPTSVPEATLLELAKPVRHHRTGEFRALFKEVQALLQYVFQTSQTVLTITGSGTAAFEAGFASVARRGTKVLNISNGKFAERWGSYATTFGCERTELKLPYGTAATAEMVQRALSEAKFDLVTMVHSETSTATVCDLQSIARTVRKTGDTLLMVDGITSIGALPFRMDEWGVDIAVTGSQKALMLPPGLGFVAFSDRAWQRIDQGSPESVFYFDVRKYRRSMEDGDTPFTPANTLIEALRVSLEMIRTETIDAVWKRTHTIASAFRSAMQAIGLELFSESPSDSVTAVKYPEGVVDKEFRNELKNRHNIHLAGGQGTMEGKIFRVNHMGYTDAYDCLAAVAAIEVVLAKRMVDFGPASRGITAAMKELSKVL